MAESFAAYELSTKGFYMCVKYEKHRQYSLVIFDMWKIHEIFFKKESSLLEEETFGKML